MSPKKTVLQAYLTQNKRISPAAARKNMIRAFEKLAFWLNDYATGYVHPIIPEATPSETIQNLTTPDKKTLVDLSFSIRRAQTEYIQEIKLAENTEQRFKAYAKFIAAFIVDDLVSLSAIDTPILVEQSTLTGADGPCIRSNAPYKNYGIFQYSEEVIQFLKLNENNYIHLPELKEKFANFYAAIKTYQSCDASEEVHYIKTWIMERITTLQELDEHYKNAFNPIIPAHPINEPEQSKAMELQALYRQRRIYFGVAVLSGGALAIMFNINHIHPDWEPPDQSTLVILSVLDALALGYFGGKLSWSIDPEEDDPEAIQIEKKYEEIQAVALQRRVHADNNQDNIPTQPLWSAATARHTISYR